MLRPIPAEPRRILIVRLGALGDVARVLPMLNGLRTRFPAAEIDWVVQAKAADLLYRDYPASHRELPAHQPVRLTPERPLRGRAAGEAVAQTPRMVRRSLGSGSAA